MTLGGKPRSLEFEEDEEEQKPRDAKSALKDVNAVDSSTVSLQGVTTKFQSSVTQTTLGQKSSIYPKILILEISFLTKFIFAKPHFSQIHIFQTSNSW